MKKFIAVACLLAVASALWGRTWTDTKGRQIKGDFVEVQDEVVVVKKDGWKITKIPIAVLSDEDKAFVAKMKAEEEKRRAAVGSDAGKAAEGEDAQIKLTSKVGKELDGLVLSPDGKRYKFTGSEPQYFAYYYSASW